MQCRRGDEVQRGVNDGRSRRRSRRVEVGAGIDDAEEREAGSGIGAAGERLAVNRTNTTRTVPALCVRPGKARTHAYRVLASVHSPRSPACFELASIRRVRAVATSLSITGMEVSIPARGQPNSAPALSRRLVLCRCRTAVHNTNIISSPRPLHLPQRGSPQTKVDLAGRERRPGSRRAVVTSSRTELRWAAWSARLRRQDAVTSAERTNIRGCPPV
ncbi:hypothetical protein OH76DRAFT_1002846 [Lentinus brumalis]|uniref:Uncharacterized protein n=1 Tax=Lentinus brumalis TaxID=2498619 RepID=A0A371DQL6_9APHY|nr:hypothetical protein OH76DRAFT_1002846 [Polyporus brumalis]